MHLGLGMRKNHYLSFLCGIITIYFALGSARAQEADANRYVEKAVEAQARNDLDSAARSLRDAHIAAGRIDDDKKRKALETKIEQLASRCDPLFRKRRDLERREAERYRAMAQTFLDGLAPRTALLFIRDLELFDHITAAELKAQAEDLIAGQDKDSKLASLDAALSLLVNFAEMGASDREDLKKRQKRLSRSDKFKRMKTDFDLYKWIESRKDAAVKMKKIALGYRSKGRLELAYETATIAFSLYREGTRKEYGEIQKAAREERSKQRYLSLAKPHMEDLKRACTKSGASKLWKFKGMKIVAPPPRARDSMILSKKTLGDDYSIETDLRIANILGKMMIIFAAKDGDNLLAVEFERPRKPHSHIRIVHIDGGNRKVLAESQAYQTMRSFFRIRLEVRGGEAVARLGDRQCQTRLPSGFDREVCFGFLRPGTGSKPIDDDKDRTIEIQNLIVTSPLPDEREE